MSKGLDEEYEELEFIRSAEGALFSSDQISWMWDNLKRNTQ